MIFGLGEVMTQLFNAAGLDPCYQVDLRLLAIPALWLLATTIIHSGNARELR